jgi:structural hemagglutinin/hemolysin toxin protein RtxA
MKNGYYYFYYYAPKSHLKITKQAIFAAGAGNVGNYSCCAWETKGVGQFKPEKESNAYIGKIGKIKKISEYKVEIICPSSKIKKIIAALKQSHPYEHPVFGILELTNL